MADTDQQTCASSAIQTTPSGKEICTRCRDAGREYRIEERPAGPAPSFSMWRGVPQYRRVCTGCGGSDGPWVKADHVGCF